jgi:AcrR family transcriptional regulator
MTTTAGTDVITGSRRTRDAIVAGARRAFRTRGYDMTRMVDVAACAGVSEASAYRYFRTKSEVFEAVRLEVEADLRTAVTGLGRRGAIGADLVEVAVAATRVMRHSRWAFDAEMQHVSESGWSGPPGRPSLRATARELVADALRTAAGSDAGVIAGCGRDATWAVLAALIEGVTRDDRPDDPGQGLALVLQRVAAS